MKILNIQGKSLLYNMNKFSNYYTREEDIIIQAFLNVAISYENNNYI